MNTSLNPLTNLVTATVGFGVVIATGYTARWYFGDIAPIVLLVLLLLGIAVAVVIAAARHTLGLGTPPPPIRLAHNAGNANADPARAHDTGAIR
ncbi:hypothetical protein [Pseudonocardia sp. NPDC046786]|uniref:hypothetical protein n=1 Tax=Pseudonocardia sp. NPDC046786 TaxID=3155471 RepID=UPI0033C0D8CD